MPSSAWLVCCATWSCGATIPDGHDGWFFDGLLALTIGDSARPGSRRLIPGLQPPMAERTGSRHARSSFNPSSRLARSSFHCGWTVHNPLRRGGPPCPPVRVGTKMGFVDAYAALAGWMHRVCADLAGCYEIPGWCLVRLCWFDALPVHVGRPSPMVTTGLFRIDFLILTIVNGARPGSRRMIPGLQPPMAERTGSRHARSSFNPSSRLARSSFHCGWTAHNPLRRGGPPRPPVLPDSYIHFGMCFRGQAWKLSPTATASPRSSHYSRHPQRGRRCTNPPRRKHRVKL